MFWTRVEWFRGGPCLWRYSFSRWRTRRELCICIKLFFLKVESICFSMHCVYIELYVKRYWAICGEKMIGLEVTNKYLLNWWFFELYSLVLFYRDCQTASSNGLKNIWFRLKGQSLSSQFLYASIYGKIDKVGM